MTGQISALFSLRVSKAVISDRNTQMIELMGDLKKNEDKAHIFFKFTLIAKA